MTLASRRLERKGERWRVANRPGKPRLQTRRPQWARYARRKRDKKRLSASQGHRPNSEKSSPERERSSGATPGGRPPDCSRRVKAPARLAAALLFPLHVYWGIYNPPCDRKRNALVESRRVYALRSPQVALLCTLSARTGRYGREGRRVAVNSQGIASSCPGVLPSAYSGSVPMVRSKAALECRAFVLLHHLRSRGTLSISYGELWQGITKAQPSVSFLFSFCLLKVLGIFTTDIDTIRGCTATVINVDFVNFTVDFVITSMISDPGANNPECACFVFSLRGQRNTLISASLPRGVSSHLAFPSYVTSKQLFFFLS